MRKPIHSELQARFLDLLRQARTRARLTQTELAERLGKPQSFVAKVEGGERRLDVVEFIMVAQALEADPAAIIRELTPEAELWSNPR